LRIQTSLGTVFRHRQIQERRSRKSFQGRTSRTILLHTPSSSKPTRTAYFLSCAYRIVTSPAHSTVAGEWSDSVGVASLASTVTRPGHTNPRSLVQNLHGTARHVWQERGSRIGTCQTVPHSLLRATRANPTAPQPRTGTTFVLAVVCAACQVPGPVRF